MFPLKTLEIYSTAILNIYVYLIFKFYFDLQHLNNIVAVFSIIIEFSFVLANILQWAFS